MKSVKFRLEFLLKNGKGILTSVFLLSFLNILKKFSTFDFRVKNTLENCVLVYFSPLARRRRRQTLFRGFI